MRVWRLPRPAYGQLRVDACEGYGAAFAISSVGLVSSRSPRRPRCIKRPVRPGRGSTREYV